MPTRYCRLWRRCLSSLNRQICGTLTIAKQLWESVKDESRAMQHFDAIVAGAGPAGSSAALAMARAGLRVALIERGEYPGAKNVSGAALYSPNLLADPLPEYWEEAPVER